MAVIKIVPMPGAVGDKGDEGAVGPRGLQGEQGLQGAPGADALWNYNGEYNPGAGYAVGDVVTFEGQTWYRKNSNGGNVGDTPSEGLFWDLIAAKGEAGEPGLNGLEGETGATGPQGEQGPQGEPGTPGSLLNYWDGTGAPQDPAEDGFLILDGIVTGLGSSLLVSASDTILINANNGEFLNDATILSNQIATIGDIDESIANANGNLLQSVRWTPNFTATGLTFTGSGATHPTYNSHYVKQGQLVSFWIAVDCSTVTSFGTGQLNLELPFAPLAGTMNHFSGWVFVDETANPDLAGHIIVNADHLPNTQTLDLHYIKQQGGANSPVMEAMLKQNTPVVLTTNTNIYVNGTYISA